MKILIIADEVWNDRINGNNVLTNWFQGFPAEFAEVYATPGTPFNSICQYYFQITDREMVQSIKTGVKAGRVLKGDFSRETRVLPYNSTDINNIGFMRKHMGNLLRFLKTIVWNYGIIDEEKFGRFIEDFKPDIIFSTRFSHSKILRLERLALKYAKCPIVAFTGDNEYSLRRYSFNPLFWFNLFYQRNCLRKMMINYSLYYTLSERQIEEYQHVFNVPMKILRKCSAKPMGKFIIRPVGKPIKIVYGGKLYAGRDKTIAELGEAIREVNKEELFFQLHIYTGSKVADVIGRGLNDKINTFLHSPISSSELEKVYHNSDIALSVESFDLSLRLETRVSFSTKLIDCLNSTCAVMMIGWKENSGFEYLNKNKVAICIDSIKNILPTLRKIISNPEIIQVYKQNAYKCMVMNHDRNKIQSYIFEDFSNIINAQTKKVN